MISLGLQTKDYETVRKYGEALLVLSRDHPVALESLAAAAFARNDMDQAQRLCTKLTQLAPKEFEYWFNLGLACQRQGKFNDAIQAYVRARTLRPELSHAHIQLGAVYQKSAILRAPASRSSAPSNRHPSGAIFNTNSLGSASSKGILRKLRSFTRRS